jgi:ubiquinone biosynthesis protein Coq4
MLPDKAVRTMAVGFKRVAGIPIHLIQVERTQSIVREIEPGMRLGKAAGIPVTGLEWDLGTMDSLAAFN